MKLLRPEFTDLINLPHSRARTKSVRWTRVTTCKPRLLPVALSVPLFGSSTTASQAETSLEQQLELLKSQVAQQQCMI